MKKVLLINQESIPHYRVAVYNHLAASLAESGYELTVASDGVQPGNAEPVRFVHADIPLTFWNLARTILVLDPDAVIYWVRLRHLYLFPTLILLKLLGVKTIYWGHGSDLAKKDYVTLKTWGNYLEYLLSDAMILYAEHLRKHVSRRFERKIFIANNTLCFDGFAPPLNNSRKLLERYRIATPMNIVCMGRMQRRKRLENLLEAFRLLNRPGVGLVFVGPDSDGILRDVNEPNVFKLGPIYGALRLELLAAMDIFCLPGAVGLSIVDAFYCGLPLVTEAGDESPEIMYLKDGRNGFVVPRDDPPALAEKLALLIDDDELRARFACAAKREIMSNGHIDRLCDGFRRALGHVFREPSEALPAAKPNPS